MTYILHLLVLFFVSNSYAEVFSSSVYNIDYSTEPGSPHLIMFDNARVAFLNQNDHHKIPEILKRKGVLDVKIDKELNFISAIPSKVITAPVSAKETYVPPLTYEPSVITPEFALTIFERMRKNYQNNSQCYNRAHVWAWEEFQKSALNSIKLFMFFTSRYIRNYRYKWWFHVTPMTYVSVEDKQEMLTLDRRFSKTPLPLKEWTDIFIHSKRDCPIVSKYSDYRNNQYKEDCYLIPVSQYYWQPRDIDYFEKTGKEKNSFISTEVDWAYYEAF